MTNQMQMSSLFRIVALSGRGRTVARDPGRAGVALRRFAPLLISVGTALMPLAVSAQPAPEQPSFVEPVSSITNVATPGNFAAAKDSVAAGSDYGFIEQQIRTGEWLPAIDVLRSDIDKIGDESHRFDSRLAEPLSLLGDALLAKGDVPDALDAYGHALHITRVNDGLHTANQVDLVYKEANAYRAGGDFSQANRREEYAFVVLKKSHGPYARELLPGIFRLANWYTQTNNVYAARGLYQHAVRVIEANGDDSDPQLVHSLRGLANTYKTERFPPFYLDGANTDVNAVTANNTGVPDARLDVSNFPAGERALKRIIKLTRAKVVALEADQLDETQLAAAQMQQPPAEETEAELAPMSEALVAAKLDMGTALIELGDWHLMFDKPRLAVQYYELGQSQQENLPATVPKVSFERPQLLYFPTPNDPRPPALRRRGAQQRGFVEVQYTISDRGTVVGLKTIASEPKGLMDYRVRKSLRATRYRPPFVEGVPTATPDHSYRYEYSYYPKLETDESSARANDAPTSQPTSQSVDQSEAVKANGAARG